jgi:hypothetical protein
LRIRDCDVTGCFFSHPRRTGAHGCRAGEGFDHVLDAASGQVCVEQRFYGRRDSAGQVELTTGLHVSLFGDEGHVAALGILGPCLVEPSFDLDPVPDTEPVEDFEFVDPQHAGNLDRRHVLLNIEPVPFGAAVGRA